MCSPHESIAKVTTCYKYSGCYAGERRFAAISDDDDDEDDNMQREAAHTLSSSAAQVNNVLRVWQYSAEWMQFDNDTAVT